jgi:hypothetical protein
LPVPPLGALLELSVIVSKAKRFFFVATFLLQHPCGTPARNAQLSSNMPVGIDTLMPLRFEKWYGCVRSEANMPPTM